MPDSQPLPRIFISKEIVDDKINNYLTDKYPLLINGQKEKGDERNETKSIWYPKSTLETWLREAELMNADGMRIYFGAYNESETEIAGQLCLVMVLTRANESSAHTDIVYENEPDFTDRQNATSASRDFNENTIGEEDPRQFNYGAPCPPIC